LPPLTHPQKRTLAKRNRGESESTYRRVGASAYVGED
jgi:hypothetical protein